MALEGKRTEIDGVRIYCAPFDVIKQCTMLTRLLRIVAPVVGKLGGLNFSRAMEMSMAELAPAISAMMAGIDPEDVGPLLLEILGSTAATGKFGGAKKDQQVSLLTTEDVNLVFKGRLPTLLKVAKFALEVNYAGFFPERKPTQPTGAATPDPEATEPQESD